MVNGVDNVVARAVEWIDGITGIDEYPEKTIADDINLSQNYTNPFNPTTTINYQLPVNSDINLSIYNMLGQKVATLVNKKQADGSYKVQWDATGFASGVYLYQLKAGAYIKNKKLILMK